MSEVEFTIDAATGKLEMYVKGVSGPACDDVAKHVRDLLGEPGHEQNTGEYYLRPRVTPQIRPKAGA